MAMVSNLLFAVIACFLLVKITKWWDSRKDGKDQVVASEQTQIENTVEKETNMEKNIRTRDLFLEVLTKIGCQYQLGEGDDTRIFFAFQGENMFADASNESLYVVVWDTYWEHVELYDIDEVSRMRKAINNSNLNSSVTTVYTIDKEGSNMDVHSRSMFAFVPQMPSIEDYLKAELGKFFRAHQLVGNELQKLRIEEQTA
jgi:hypothetical protein